MFLISKIVRGRRLLHELEAETEKKASQEATAAEVTRAEKSMGEMSQSGAGPSNENSSATAASPHRRSNP
ncbi:unnamed protein product [Onchocerca flexuosa]|uniref:Uncharacterized protein n=1 Tax=Onchocerca flexuosa TaxID=387005 RepID=A0A183H2K2_9BILA|nr:unnamed protein product [Onchocerca flexuosa]